MASDLRLKMADWEVMKGQFVFKFAVISETVGETERNFRPLQGSCMKNYKFWNFRFTVSYWLINIFFYFTSRFILGMEYLEKYGIPLSIFQGHE